ncbi:hypothetical protein SKAU_G00211880 [Synaphobranchus kaupii]|uniref:Programmed cell death 6-interacting protein n=1 Tax=Synaphobranchus kaupii TaxID=118154 RepID=A0A9Q1F916_SYNKA|nr:hypothetical protein SKAU_G00211880 [Synaphobranchus kaupii]
MATFISVPLKKSEEVDLVKPLSKFITSIYTVREEQTDHIRAVEELNKLRISALGRPLDKHERSLEILLRYYDQLCAVEPKFPFSDNQLCLTFTWNDAFDKGSLFSGPVKLALANLSYEKTCVLFNVGALASQIASEQNVDNDEGRKTAAKLYQLASGVFSHIKDTVLSAMSQEPTVDISPDTTSALSHVMLAQAQEVFFLKATADRMKNAIIAKLANQAADLYGEAYRQCQSKENLPKCFYFQEIPPVLAAKHCIMQAYAEYHQSTLAKQNKKFGEEIARLQYATTLMKTVTSRYNEYVNVKDLSDKITRALTAAKKDNDFIYHDRVPEPKDLDRIGKASLVKPTAIQMPMSQKFSDLFQKMVPMAVQQSLSMYNQRKAEIVNRLIGTMREASSLCSGVLSSLNLPAALEDLSGDSIPPSILEKSCTVIRHGGLQSIEKLIKDLPDMLQRNKEILDESLRMLGAEESSDSELRTKFGQHWNRNPSGELYKPLRTEGMNFRSLLDKALQSDSLVRERYAIHSPMVALLCKSAAELRAAIPCANPAKTLHGSEVVSSLRSLLAQLDKMKKQREQIESSIRSAQFDMTGTFLSTLAQGGAINEEALSARQLDSTYGGYSQEVQKSLKTQEELLTNVQTMHRKFSGMKQSSSESIEREEVMKKLASAYDSYIEISTNLREGMKFYGDFTVMLLKFQNNCSDIVFCAQYRAGRVTEADPADFCRPTPAPRTVFNKPIPPARPPPPSILQAANSAPPSSTAPAQTSSTPSVGTPGLISQAQGPPYPTYQGYPGFFPMPMGWSPFGYGQYSMPYVPFENLGQIGYPAGSQVQPQNQPNYP